MLLKIASLFTLLVFNMGAILFSSVAFSENAIIKHALFDGIDNIDGLDNPRQALFTPDGKHLFVTSADDNSLLMLATEKRLTPKGLFKNTENPTYKLEGASGLVRIGEINAIAVSSFYASAISVFRKTHKNALQFDKSYSDDLGYERVFKSSAAILDEDKLGLLGPQEMVISHDYSRLYVASYMSNALSVFNIHATGALTFQYKVSSNSDESFDLGKPVSLALSDSGQRLVVAGYENHSLNVFDLDETWNLSLAQTIDAQSVPELKNPMKLLLSEDAGYLYVACAGSHSIQVFAKRQKGYVLLQSVDHSITDGSGLTGVGSMALTSDGKQLFAAGEFDSGLLQFAVTTDGKLQYMQTIQSENHRIEGVTSISVHPNEQSLALTLGKMDALYIIEYRNPKH